MYFLIGFNKVSENHQLYVIGVIFVSIIIYNLQELVDTLHYSVVL